MAKRRDVIRFLESHGFVSDGGTKHEKFCHPDGRKTVVPRYREINELTLRLILRQAGLM